MVPFLEVVHLSAALVAVVGSIQLVVRLFLIRGQVAVVVSLMEQLGEVIRQAGQCDAQAISQVGQIAAAVSDYVRQAAAPAA